MKEGPTMQSSTCSPTASRMTRMFSAMSPATCVSCWPYFPILTPPPSQRWESEAGWLLRSKGAHGRPVLMQVRPLSTARSASSARACAMSSPPSRPAPKCPLPPRVE